MIRFVNKQDARYLCDIYNYYVENTHNTFEEELVSEVEMQARIASANKNMPWLVVEEPAEKIVISPNRQESKILGYAYVGPWKARAAYKHSVEISIYLDHTAEGRGLGTYLYQKLIDEINRTPIHCLMAVIALPNSSSVAIHEKFGFEKVAHLTEVGRKFNQWVDVGYWQRIIDKKTVAI